MKTARVELGPRSYEVRIGAGLINKTGQFLKELGLSGKAMLITNPNINRLHGPRMGKALAEAGFAVTTLEVPEGEAQKTLENAVRLWGQLTEAGAERETPVVAMGGGVLGDLAGFVAGTYMRGIPLIQAPTTLLGMVDSGIGGKTGVDHGNLKNRIGVFYQPKMTIADLDLVKTLPAEEISNGLAEIIKSAAIKDKEFFVYLEENIEKIRNLEAPYLEEAVYRTAKIKAEVVARDEHDLGLRNILNFGHTIGHGIESTSGFNVKHGQAVAIGMYAAARLSNYLDILDISEVERLKKLIERAGLPTRIPQVNLDDLAKIMAKDKKMHHEKFRFVVLRTIGDAFTMDAVPPEIVGRVTQP